MYTGSGCDTLCIVGFVIHLGNFTFLLNILSVDAKQSTSH